MEEFGTKLLNVMNDFMELEILKSQILYAKFQNTLKEDYDIKIKSVEENFLGKARLYGKSVADCENEKNSIVGKYKVEFQKIYDSRREQYINLQNEIQEMVANKMVVIANFKQIAVNKQEFIKSDKYVEYINKKKKYQNIIDTTLNSEEYNKHFKLLEELKNPLDIYDKKFISLATKFDNYDEAIIQCEKKLEECIEAAKGDFNEIMKFIDTSLELAKKENIFSKIINKILNSLSKDSKFKNNVIQKMENDIINIQKDNEEIVKLIENQTIGLIATIEEVRANINAEFNVAIG